MADTKKNNPKDYERFGGKVGITVIKKPSNKKTVKRGK